MKKLEYVKSKTGEMYCWVCSILAVLAMNCKMEYVDGGKDSALLNGLYKLGHAFDSYNFTDVFLIAAVFLLIRYVTVQGAIRGSIWIRVFSLMLSLFYIVSLSYCKYDSAEFLFGDRLQVLLAAMCIVGYYIIIYYVLCLLIMCIERNRERPALQDESEDFVHRHMWLTVFLIIFLCWLPWIFMNYPGTDEPDSVNQMKQYLGDRAFTAHHPPLSTYIMGTFNKSFGHSF